VPQPVAAPQNQPQPAHQEVAVGYDPIPPRPIIQSNVRPPTSNNLVSIGTQTAPTIQQNNQQVNSLQLFDQSNSYEKHNIPDETADLDQIDSSSGALIDSQPLKETVLRKRPMES
jgi:hypothetical protein